MMGLGAVGGAVAFFQPFAGCAADEEFGARGAPTVQVPPMAQDVVVVSGSRFSVLEDDVVMAGLGTIQDAPFRAEQVSMAASPRIEYRPWDFEQERGLIVERGPVVSGRWEVIRKLADGTPVRSDTFVLTPEGHVAIAESIDPAEKVEVVFDPPMVVMPNSLVPTTAEPGELTSSTSPADAVPEAFVQTLEMIVHPLGDRSIVQTRGPVTQRVIYLGSDRVSTPVGIFNARRVRTIFEAKAGPAVIDNRTDAWFVDGLGLVSERRVERTTVMGVPLRSSDERWVMAETEAVGVSRASTD